MNNSLKYLAGIPNANQDVVYRGNVIVYCERLIRDCGWDQRAFKNILVIEEKRHKVNPGPYTPNSLSAVKTVFLILFIALILAKSALIVFAVYTTWNM